MKYDKALSVFASLCTQIAAHSWKSQALRKHT